MKKSSRKSRAEDASGRGKTAKAAVAGAEFSSGDTEFASLISAFAEDPEVTSGGKGFGSLGLKVNGKLFAMPVRGRLVLKLPKARVDALVQAGEGAYFDPGHGRLMKEWVVLDPRRPDRLDLARGAYRFVRDGRA
jgi:hypothetical protein